MTNTTGREDHLIDDALDFGAQHEGAGDHITALVDVIERLDKVLTETEAKLSQAEVDLERARSDRDAAQVRVAELEWRSE